MDGTTADDVSLGYRDSPEFIRAAWAAAQQNEKQRRLAKVVDMAEPTPRREVEVIRSPKLLTVAAYQFDNTSLMEA